MSSDILNKVYDLVIVGGGIAGASAAIYAARAKLSTLVIDKVQNVGTLSVTDKIANYPGLRESVTGLELLTRMQVQAKSFGAIFAQSNILTVDFTKETKEITVTEGIVKAKSVFIAVGAKTPTNMIKGEEAFLGRGVSYCSTYDPAFYHDKLVVIIGDTDKVIEETATLSKFCKEVRLLVPRTLHVEAGLAILEEKRNVVILLEHSIKEIKGTNLLEKIVVLNENHEELEWDIDGLILNVGRMKPETDFLKNSVQRDEEGYIIVDEHLRTNVPGVFAGGDSRHSQIKQPVISAADGAIAALAADGYINRKPQS
ncbi:NAD(P)/FAD-dependent oxidoreductase [Anaerobacillus sp. CMMVII]|uniref:NAD(P)/FAD-dependent oxidoreductase n=1 Tax=Anaerobacillus sp. CMMVII TaxID=2755588 RepID=UPI0021B6F3C7|nr:FAD-dependent oxidoreductase [Anaerobacillus sp. CMMVII]